VKTLFKIKGTTMWLSEECESLEYFGKAKTDTISVILFGRMWV